MRLVTHREDQRRLRPLLSGMNYRYDEPAGGGVDHVCVRRDHLRSHLDSKPINRHRRLALSSRSMRCACVTVSRMQKMIQIRNVPEATHRTLKARAAQRGLSLSDYLLAQVQQLADLPTIEELNARIRTRKPVRGSSAKAIRRWRDAS